MDGQFKSIGRIIHTHSSVIYDNISIALYKTIFLKKTRVHPKKLSWKLKMNPWKRRCLFKNRPIIFSFQFPPVASFCFQKSRNQPCQQNMTIINRFHHESTEGTHWSIEVLRVVRTHGCHWRSSSIGIGIFLETKHGEALAECCKVNVVEKKNNVFFNEYWILCLYGYHPNIFFGLMDTPLY